MKEPTTAKPTDSQAALIRYFATTEPVTVRANHGTYRVCGERGWIERIDEFPFHRATDSGRRAIGLL